MRWNKLSNVKVRILIIYDLLSFSDLPLHIFEGWWLFSRGNSSDMLVYQSVCLIVQWKCIWVHLLVSCPRVRYVRVVIQLHDKGRLFDGDLQGHWLAWLGEVSLSFLFTCHRKLWLNYSSSGCYDSLFHPFIRICEVLTGSRDWRMIV